MAGIIKEGIEQGYHIVWATTGTRVSERIILYKIKPQNVVWLDENMRRCVYEAIKEKALQNQIKIFSLNVLPDHVHLLILSQDNSISDKVRILKGYSSYKIGKSNEYTKHGNGRTIKIWA